MNAQQRYDRLIGDIDYLMTSVQQMQMEMRYFMGAMVLVILIMIFKR